MTYADGRVSEETVADILDIVRRGAQQLDESAAFPVTALESLKSSGLLGILATVADGGCGGTLREMLAISQRLAREDLSVALIFAMHCQQIAALVHCADSPPIRAVLRRVLKERHYLASVTTAASTGSNLLAADSPLTADDGRLDVDREAPVVTGVEHADGFLITMRAPGAAGEAEVCMVYADRADLDVSVTGDWQSLGMRACRSPAAQLRGSISTGQILAERQAHTELVTRIFAPVAHLGWAACWMGCAAGALERTVRYLSSKEGRRRHDPAGQLLLTRLGRARGRLEGVNAQLHHALALVEENDDRVVAAPAQLVLNSLKISAAEQCLAVVDDLIELVGLRHGYLRDSPLQLERAFRDLRAASLNYANDRLLLANGRLAFFDREVNLV